MVVLFLHERKVMQEAERKRRKKTELIAINHLVVKS